MKDDRFRPDAAARRVMAPDLGRQLARDRLFYGASFADVTIKDGEVTKIERVPPTMSGNRGDRVLIDDPHSKPGGVTEEERAQALALFNPSEEEVARLREELAGARSYRSSFEDQYQQRPEPRPDPAEVAAAKASFEERRKPLAGVGRNSIPKSHRGEGLNYVD